MAKYREKTLHRVVDVLYVVEAEQYLPGQPLPFVGRGIVQLHNGIPCVPNAQGLKAPLLPGDWVVVEPGKSGGSILTSSSFHSKYEPAPEV